ncbi:hypothetical protein OESDEN_19727 [Oesophagostomum dentatum]|uniref:Uncharacterized protein n=1 Tax=Oesophagostomum dentatum TaxID=61180 RepID=A0A0B1S9M5_OESDE|nr:hypothetical protein OESDEN_19727 [Oesophagostomum dentatum]
MRLLTAVILTSTSLGLAQADSNIEILPDNCDCRDWYGACRREGDRWTDDETWMYECNGRNGTDAAFRRLCYSDTFKGDGAEPHCLVDGQIKKVRSEFRDGRFQWLCLETGRWVVGCFYANETHPDVYLKIGEHGYNGLIKHVCDRYEDYPGRVQYYAEVRKDVHVKHPTNKGINKNFPEPADLRIKDKVDRWLHESASMFIANEEILRGKIRYLPASRRQWPTGEH